MAKSKVSEWDSVASNNIILNGINIDENCPPSAVNNAIREMMAQIKDWQSGSSGDDWTSSGVLNVTGSLKLDGNLGTDGQVLTSKGSSATPTWESLPVYGTMATQNSDNVNITGGSIKGLTTLETSDGTISSNTIQSNEFKVGTNWTIHQSGAYLYFRYNGNNVMRLASNGHLVCENNITAFQGV